MGDFLATPFLLLAQACLWLVSFLNGKAYFLMEATYDDEDDRYGDEDL